MHYIYRREEEPEKINWRKNFTCDYCSFAIKKKEILLTIKKGTTIPDLCVHFWSVFSYLLLLVQLFRPRIIMTKITAKMTKRRTMAMRTATIGNSLMGLLEANSVVVAANCFSAGCNQKFISCWYKWRRLSLISHCWDIQRVLS